MPFYRRLFVPGGTRFFTVALADRSSRLLVEHVGALRGAFRYARGRRPFDTVAITVLPDHIHCIWSLPERDDDVVTRWRLVKSSFTRALSRGAAEPEDDDRAGGGLWGRRFWEHPVADEAELDSLVAYIHGDAVKHGHARTPEEWPYSSWRRFNREDGLPWSPPPDGFRVKEPGRR